MTNPDPGESARLEELTQTIVSLSQLDFSVRPRVDGTGPLAAVATGLLALAEELEANVVARQAAEAANESKARFLSTISHELRTPLTTILGSVELLKQTPLSMEQKHHLSEMTHAGNHLHLLIANILDFADIQRETITYAEDSFDLEALIGALVDTVAPHAEQKGLDLHDERDASLRVQLRGDRARLTQVLSNLLTNAVTYTQEGSVRLVSQISGVGSTAQLRFEVHDTGPGIPPERTDEIFESFSRLDMSPTRTGAGLGLGLGLGLSIARHLTVGMGGSLLLAKTGPTGSVFRLDLTLERDLAQPIPIPEVQPGSLDGLHVLLVEDTDPVRMVIATMLEILGCTVTAVESGHAALATIEAIRPQIIFMDQEMPGIDGIETSRRIRARLGTETPPIIAITAHGSTADQQRSLSAGMVGHVTKPCELATLQKVLARHRPN